MPPWLPDAGSGPFVGERRLAPAEIERIAAWVEQGAPRGDPALLPPRPHWTEGWQLGEPDLVVSMTAPYTLAADGFDIYRNFVLPVALPRRRFVRAVEFRPGNPKVVHHARLFVDAGRRSRSLDAADAAPGFAGMSLTTAESPSGAILGWTPGKVPQPSPEGVAWTLAPGSDLVLQLHLVPSGRPETVRARVGLYFTDEPPRRETFAFVLGSRDIDIPAGSVGVAVEDDYTLPVDVEVLSLYPHAHYLGHTVRAEARLPDGTTRTLLSIRDWDFNWQDEYRFVDPMALPAGTRVHLRTTFDNSEDNPRNPFVPPRRVTYGASTRDEMAELMVQVVARRPADRALLERDFERKRTEDAITFRLRRLVAHPDSAEDLAALGASYLHAGRFDQAEGALRRAVALDPSDAIAWNNLGYALRRRGRAADAAAPYRAALRLDPGLAEAHQGLATALRALGRDAEARDELEAALALAPDSPALLTETAWLLATSTAPGVRAGPRALELARRADTLSGGAEPAAAATLAAALAASGRFDEAVSAGERALQLAAGSPDAAEIRRQLGLYRAGRPFEP